MKPAVLPSTRSLYPVTSPESAMLRGWVLFQPAREKSVYVDPLRMNPWVTAAVAPPVITPPLLMPRADT